MTTWGSHLLKFLNAFFDRRDKLSALGLEKIQKASEHMEQIAKTLAEAVAAFDRSPRPWEKVREVDPHLNGLVTAIRHVLEEEDKLLSLHAELQLALRGHQPLLSKSREQNILHAVTIRAEGQGANADATAISIKALSKTQLHTFVNQEYSSLRGASDLFRTLARELREMA